MPPEEILDFLAERLRVQLRAEGARHDVLAATFAAGADDDITRLLARTEAVTSLLGAEDGTHLLTAYRRVANILRIEDRKDGPHTGEPDHDLLVAPDEQTLARTLQELGHQSRPADAAGRFPWRDGRSCTSSRAFGQVL